MRPAPLIVFDLDDTLYLERDFARSGYAAAERVLEGRQGAEGFGKRCLELLDGGCRERIFDAVLAEVDLAGELGLVDRLVEAYRAHVPDIRLAQDAEHYFRSRGAPLHAALITDGLAAVQENKIRALGLHAVLEYIVCTGRLGHGLGKPHPRPFELVEAWASRYQAPLVYVADNPLKDFVTPNGRGWRTVQILRPQRIHCYEAPDEGHRAHAIITALDELDRCVEALAQ